MPLAEILIPVHDYDLAATLDSGQAFRWQRHGEVWTGLIGHRPVRLQWRGGDSLSPHPTLHAQTPVPVPDWHWLTHYLQSDLDLAAILQTFPADAPMQNALAVCRGLRLLRQDPWECLASFMLSSTKQIVQIRQIIALLCERHGAAIDLPSGWHTPLAERGSATRSASPAPATPKSVSPVPRQNPLHAFPTPAQIARLSEAELRACKMGFRAPNLLAAARRVDAGVIDLESIRNLPHAEARAELMKFRGVGGKIADCVLLFAYGCNAAFPVDVWIKRALRDLYFPRRRPSEKHLHRFAATHFGPHGGYAQQYLFHYMRTKSMAASRPSAAL